MIILAPTHSLEIVSVASTNAYLMCVAHFLDNSAGVPFAPGTQFADISTAPPVTTTIVSAPGGSISRMIMRLTVLQRNNASTHSFYMVIRVGATPYQLLPANFALLAGEMLEYEHGRGFMVKSPTGQLKLIGV